MLPEDQTTSQSIRHKKLHRKRYQECPDWTILRDFRLFEVKINYKENRGNRETQLFDFELKHEPLRILIGA